MKKPVTYGQHAIGCIFHRVYAYWERQPVTLRPVQLAKALNVSKRILVVNSGNRNDKRSNRPNASTIRRRLARLSRSHQPKITAVLEASLLITQQAKRIRRYCCRACFTGRCFSYAGSPQYKCSSLCRGPYSTQSIFPL